MAKMFAAPHGRNQDERPDCCRADDKFRAPRMTRLHRKIQRARERRAWQRETLIKQSQQPITAGR